MLIQCLFKSGTYVLFQYAAHCMSFLMLCSNMKSEIRLLRNTRNKTPVIVYECSISYAAH
jgi:hypothetical protein